MNIFNKVTLQSMKKSRTKTIVTIIGVVLSAMMITAVSTFAVSLQDYMVNGAVQKYGDWHVAFLDVPFSFIQEQKSDAFVENTAVYENIGYAVLDGGKNPDKPYLFIAGLSKEAVDTLPINLISGRLPKHSGEILIPAHVAANGGVKYSVGDTITLTVGNRMEDNSNLGQNIPYVSGGEPGKVKEILVPKMERRYTITGICERPAFEEYTAPGYTLITTADITEQADSFSVFVTLNNPHQIPTYMNDKSQAENYLLNNEVLRFMGLSDDYLFNTLLYAVAGVLVALIMLGSIFLIYNSFHISLNERIRQFGILSSVGATPKQLRNSVLFEGICIGTVGIPIGVILGIGSIWIVIKVVADQFRTILYSSVPITLKVSVLSIVIAVAVSMVTIFISAYIPARKAANTPIMESIRQTNEVKIDPREVITSKFAQHIYGLEGTLARKNFKRNKKRYRSIVLSLTLSVVLFVSASAFGRNLKRAAEQSVVDIDYDICFSTQNMEESDVFRLYDELKTADGIYNSSYQAMMTYSCEVGTSDFSDSYQKIVGGTSPDKVEQLSMDIQLIEDSRYLDFIEELGLPTEEYMGEHAKVTAVAKVKQYDEISEQKTLTNLFSKSSMTFFVTPEGDQTGQGQNLEITFVDTIPLDTIPRSSSLPKSTVFMVVAPYSMKERFEIPEEQAEMGLTFLSKDPLQSASQMETIIQEFGITSEYTLLNISKMLEQNRNIIFVVDVFTFVFVMMISLIAIANVFNSISTNIKMRRRELAMLRSVGMSDRDLSKMMNYECVFYGMQTLLLALPIAGILSWLIYKGLVIGGADITFLFPWESMVISVLGVLFVVFISMFYAVNKIKKENIMDALRDDLT